MPQSHSPAQEPRELPPRIPSSSNLHPHGSSGFIFPPFPRSRSRRLRSCQPCRSGAMSDSGATPAAPDVTEDAPWPTPDTRLGDKRHFSAWRNLSPRACWGAARALLFAGPASRASSAPSSLYSLSSAAGEGWVKLALHCPGPRQGLSGAATVSPWCLEAWAGWCTAQPALMDAQDSHSRECPAWAHLPSL